MAQRDLDAALQLLADRAQFITGASGAAIALRRQGKNDMLCRASTGSNAPELGALFSTEFGLSGESVRTRRLLRCDDAERDARVNREVCRQLGIASVVVMPVVRDDEVLGVFELFSGKTNAFGERDLSAVQRLGQMVETAVQLAQVTERLPEKLKVQESLATHPANLSGEEEILDEHILEVEAAEPAAVVAKEPDILPSPSEMPANLSQPEAEVKPLAAATAKPADKAAVATSSVVAVVQQKPLAKESAEAVSPAPKDKLPEPAKQLFWSAGVSSAASETAAESEFSHVPPVLRGLRKCEACGFPISGGRVLCVECEEKRWRGQLKRPQPLPTGAIPQSSPVNATPPYAAAQTAGAAGPLSQAASVASAEVPRPVSTAQSITQVKAPSVNAQVPAAATSSGAPQSPVSTFALSGGLEDSQSWFSSNRFVIATLLLLTALIAGFLLLR